MLLQIQDSCNTGKLPILTKKKKKRHNYCQCTGHAKQTWKIDVQYQILLALQLTKNRWKWQQKNTYGKQNFSDPQKHSSVLWLRAIAFPFMNSMLISKVSQITLKYKVIITYAVWRLLRRYCSPHNWKSFKSQNSNLALALIPRGGLHSKNKKQTVHTENNLYKF